MSSAAAQQLGPGREDTRQRILAVSLDLIARRGFSATSTREIADQLGLTKAALYYHFRTKEDLLAAVLAPIIEDLGALVAAGEQGVLDSRGLVAGYVDLVIKHEEPIRVLSQEPALARHSAVLATKPLYERLKMLLNSHGSLESSDRARLHALLGGIHAVFAFAEPDDDRALLRREAIGVAWRLLDRDDHRGARR